jgi:hypothetical protein
MAVPDLLVLRMRRRTLASIENSRIEGLFKGLRWKWRVVGGFRVEVESCWRV